MPNCTVEGCPKKAYYGVDAPIHCALHRIGGEINKTQRRCEFPECPKIPSFGNPEDRIVRHCKDHIVEGEINLTGKRCLLCSKYPSFGNPEDRIIKHCKDHTVEGEINLTGKRCLLCSKHPIFGKESRKPLHCADHIEDGEVDVMNKKCSFLGCTTLPVYGKIKGTGIHCKTHAESDEIDVRHIKCSFPGCSTRPSFGDPEDGIKKHCSEHATDGETNVVSKMCIFPCCGTIASFGYSDDGIANHCSKHKEDDELYLLHKHFCAELGCTKSASFGSPEDGKMKHCSGHQKEGEKNLHLKMCELCNLISAQFGKDKARYCHACYCYLFPDSRQARYRCFKQTTITDHLSLFFVPTTKDHHLSACSKRRPDIMYECFTHVVICEIDEDQHRDYEESCEKKRVVELWEDLACRNMIIIHFNPDGYIDSNGIRHKSCFKSKSINDKKEYDERIFIFSCVIKFYIEHVPERSFGVYLYYDGCNLPIDQNSICVKDLI